MSEREGERERGKEGEKERGRERERHRGLKRERERGREGGERDREREREKVTDCGHLYILTVMSDINFIFILAVSLPTTHYTLFIVNCPLPFACA